MSAKIKHNSSSDDATNEEERFSCNVCSIDFTLIEELLAHVTQTHTNPEDGSVSCTDCQEQLSNADEYIEHHRKQHHNHQQSKQDSQDVLVIGQLDENSSDGVNQVTILNEEGEPVTNHDENEVIASGSRKRRPTSKIREILQGETPAKKNGKQSSIHNMFAPLQSSRHSAVSNQRNEVEIDVSDVDCIRLNTNKYNDDRQATNERHEELFQYIQRVDEKLDAILKHFNVPFTPSPQVVSLDGKSSTTRFAATTLASLSSITSSNSRSSPSAASTSARSRSSNALPLAHNFFTNTPEIHTICSDKQDSQQEFTQYVISDELLEATYLRSRNRGNFSKNLVYAAFPLEERLGRNCYGRRGGSISGPKEPLEAAKLDAVREAVFRKFPAPALEEEGIWKKECVIAIDTALRSEMRQRFLSVKVDL